MQVMPGWSRHARRDFPNGNPNPNSQKLQNSSKSNIWVLFGCLYKPKSGQPQVFSLFFLLFLPHLFYYYLSLQWFFFNNFCFLLCFLQVIFPLAGVGTVGTVGVGVSVDAGAGVGAGTVVW
jgi:hypothetical protein